jgi:hypothetical protein
MSGVVNVVIGGFERIPFGELAGGIRNEWYSTVRVSKSPTPIKRRAFS